jgi:hypothetical protein
MRLAAEICVDIKKHHIPIANPRRYIERPTVPSSVDELNSVTISGAAEEYPPAHRHLMNSVSRFSHSKYATQHSRQEVQETGKAGYPPFLPYLLRTILAKILVNDTLCKAYRPVAWICWIARTPGNVYGRCIVRVGFHSCCCLLLVKQ